MANEHGVVTVFHENLELVKQSLRRQVTERREAREQEERDEADAAEPDGPRAA